MSHQESRSPARDLIHAALPAKRDNASPFIGVVHRDHEAPIFSQVGHRARDEFPDCRLGKIVDRLAHNNHRRPLRLATPILHRPNAKLPIRPRPFSRHFDGRCADVVTNVATPSRQIMRQATSAAAMLHDQPTVGEACHHVGSPRRRAAEVYAAAKQKIPCSLFQTDSAHPAGDAKQKFGFHRHAHALSVARPNETPLSIALTVPPARHSSKPLTAMPLSNRSRRRSCRRRSEV